MSTWSVGRLAGRGQQRPTGRAGDAVTVLAGSRWTGAATVLAGSGQFAGSRQFAESRQFAWFRREVAQ